MGTCIFVIHGPTVNIETGRYNIHDLTSISFRHHDLKNCAVSVCGLFKWVTTSEEQSEATLLILGSSARPGNCPLQDHPDQFGPPTLKTVSQPVSSLFHQHSVKLWRRGRSSQ